MQEQLIKFETAKLAKEKGFDIKVEKYWVNYYTGEPWNKWKIIGNMDRFILGSEYPAPTQSLLQKWLREKHGIYVNSHYFFGYEEDRFYYEIRQKTNENYLGNQDSSDSIYTFEEAFELGLKEALNLIK